MEIKQTCEEEVRDSGYYRPHQCTRNAKVERDGKHYCTIHDPVRIKEKRDARSRKWDEEARVEREKREYQHRAADYCKKKNLTIEQLNDTVEKEGEQ